MANKPHTPGDLAAAVPFTGVKGNKAPNVPLNYVTIFNVETGESAAVKPINATEAVAGGHWSRDPVDAKKKPNKSDNVTTKDAREKELRLLSALDVREIADGLDLEYTNKDEAVDAILAAEFPK